MITICGHNQVFELCRESDSTSPDGKSIINPPISLKIDTSKISSLSSYGNHTVFVMNDGKACDLGNNVDGRIQKSILNSFLKDFAKLTLLDQKNKESDVISAVCGLLYTIYLVSPRKRGEHYQLAYALKQIYTKSPMILKTGNLNPAALFGGFYHSAAIDSDGSIIFVPSSIGLEPTLKIESFPLPDGEKAVSVACLYYFMFSLSESGRVYMSKINGTRKLDFSVVEELAETKIVDISGTYRHCLAVSEDGRVFGWGVNTHGCLGIGQKDENFKKNSLIEPLNSYKIIQASAGLNHSFFRTVDGKILACGSNKYGQLPIGRDACDDIFPLTESIIKEEASFCFAGCFTSFMFIGCDAPRSPNRSISRK